jgi:hypothetical protein
LPLVKVIAAHLAPLNWSPKVEVTEHGGEGGLELVWALPHDRDVIGI